ncbi:hypothetical protein EMIT0P201_11855 [Pseudomonas chlororaphis]
MIDEYLGLLILITWAISSNFGRYKYKNFIFRTAKNIKIFQPFLYWQLMLGSYNRLTVHISVILSSPPPWLLSLYHWRYNA